MFVRTSRLFAKPEDTETSLDCQAHGVRHWSFYDFGLLANTSGHGPSTRSSLYSRCFYRLIEGSLEVKLLTIWTDEKQRWEESQKKVRSESQRRAEKKED